MSRYRVIKLDEKMKFESTDESSTDPWSILDDGSDVQESGRESSEHVTIEK